MVFESEFVQMLIQKYGYPFVSGIIRMVRAFVFVAVTGGLTYVVDHLSDFNVPVSLQAAVLAVLLGADKWWREHREDIEG